MKKQATNTLLMIQPIAFGFNAETAVNNYYQNNDESIGKNAQEKALTEFNDFVEKLHSKGVNVVVVKDTLEPHTPDSIFPNNWISFHADGQIALYPMFAKNRRLERREYILDQLEENGFEISEITDYTEAENEELFLEGTGSMILDRENEIAYGARSPRMDEGLFIEFCEDFEFTPIVFNAYQTINNERALIYHTNVMMCVADKYVVICLDSIDDKKERKTVVESLKKSNKEIIAISEEQVNQFAGNMLQVQGKDTTYLVMSSAAYNSLDKEQLKAINQYDEIIHSDLTTIETLGGGSARCMMAEVFLPKIC